MASPAAGWVSCLTISTLPIGGLNCAMAVSVSADTEGPTFWFSVTFTPCPDALESPGCKDRSDTLLEAYACSGTPGAIRGSARRFGPHGVVAWHEWGASTEPSSTSSCDGPAYAHVFEGPEAEPREPVCYEALATFTTAAGSAAVAEAGLCTYTVPHAPQG